MDDELLGLGTIEEDFEDFTEDTIEEEENWDDKTFEEIEAMLQEREETEKGQPKETSFFTLDYDKLQKEIKRFGNSKEFRLEKFGINKVLNSRLLVIPDRHYDVDNEDWGFNVTVEDVISVWHSKGAQKVTELFKVFTGKEVTDSKGLIQNYEQFQANLNLLLSLGLKKAKNGDGSLLRECCQMGSFDLNAMLIQESSQLCEDCLSAVDKLTQSTALREAEKVYLLRVLMVVTVFTLKVSNNNGAVQNLESMPDFSFVQSVNDSISALSSGDAFRNQEIGLSNVLTCLLDAYNALEHNEKETQVTLREGVVIANSLLQMLFAIPTDSLSLYCWWVTVKNHKTIYELNSFNCKVTETEEGYCFEEWLYNVVYTRKYFKTEKELLQFVTTQDLEALRESVLDEICRSMINVEIFQPQEDLSDLSPEEIDDCVLEEVSKIRTSFKINLQLPSNSEYNKLGFKAYEQFYNLIMNSLRDKQIYDDNNLKRHQTVYDLTRKVLESLKFDNFKINCSTISKFNFILVQSEKPEVDEILHSYYLVEQLLEKSSNKCDVTEVFETLDHFGIVISEKAKEMITKSEFSIEEFQFFFVKPEEYNKCVSYLNRKLSLYKDLYNSLQTLGEVGFSKKLIESSINASAIDYQIDPYMQLNNLDFREKAYFEPFNHNIHLTDLSVGSLAHELTHAIDTAVFAFVNEYSAMKHSNDLQTYAKMSSSGAKDFAKALSSQPFSNVLNDGSSNQIRETLKYCNSQIPDRKLKDVVKTYQVMWDKVESSDYYNRLLGSCLSGGASRGIEYLLTPTEILARMVATIVSETVIENADISTIQLIVEDRAIDEDHKKDFTSIAYLNPYRMSKFEVDSARKVLLETLRELDRNLPERKK